MRPITVPDRHGDTSRKGAAGRGASTHHVPDSLAAWSERYLALPSEGSVPSGSLTRSRCISRGSGPSYSSSTATTACPPACAAMSWPGKRRCGNRGWPPPPSTTTWPHSRRSRRGCRLVERTVQGLRRRVNALAIRALQAQDAAGPGEAIVDLGNATRKEVLLRWETTRNGTTIFDRLQSPHRTGAAP